VTISRKGFLKFAVSAAVSLLAGYLALRGVNLKQVFSEIFQANITLIALTLFLYVAAQVGRSLRWALLLAPLQPLSQRLLLPITSIGFLFVWILPARLGEMARPYLLCQNSDISLSAAMGSVVLERLVDATFLVAVLFLCLPVLHIPSWVLAAFRAFVFVLLTIVLLILLGSMPWWRQRFMQLAFRLLPQRIAEALVRFVDTFYTGMQGVASIQKLLEILAMTLAIWGIGLLATWILLHAMGLRLNWLAATTVLVFNALGIALPAAPGFIGSFHYAVILALGLFDVVKDRALAFAILAHFLILVVIVLMGVIFLNASGLKVSLALKRRDAG
jgi:uncharacterized protein (TIRG00374 family)